MSEVDLPPVVEREYVPLTVETHHVPAVVEAEYGQPQISPWESAHGEYATFSYGGHPFHVARLVEDVREVPVESPVDAPKNVAVEKQPEGLDETPEDVIMEDVAEDEQVDVQMTEDVQPTEDVKPADDVQPKDDIQPVEVVPVTEAFPANPTPEAEEPPAARQYSEHEATQESETEPFPDFNDPTQELLPVPPPPPSLPPPVAMPEIMRVPSRKSSRKASERSSRRSSRRSRRSIVVVDDAAKTIAEAPTAKPQPEPVSHPVLEPGPQPEPESVPESAMAKSRRSSHRADAHNKESPQVVAQEPQPKAKKHQQKQQLQDAQKVTLTTPRARRTDSKHSQFLPQSPSDDDDDDDDDNDDDHDDTCHHETFQDDDARELDYFDTEDGMRAEAGAGAGANGDEGPHHEAAVYETAPVYQVQQPYEAVTYQTPLYTYTAGMYYDQVDQETEARMAAIVMEPEAIFDADVIDDEALNAQFMASHALTEEALMDQSSDEQRLSEEAEYLFSGQQEQTYEAEHLFSGQHERTDQAKHLFPEQHEQPLSEEALAAGAAMVASVVYTTQSLLSESQSDSPVYQAEDAANATATCNVNVNVDVDADYEQLALEFEFDEEEWNTLVSPHHNHTVAAELITGHAVANVNAAESPAPVDNSSTDLLAESFAIILSGAASSVTPTPAQQHANVLGVFHSSHPLLAPAPQSHSLVAQRSFASMTIKDTRPSDPVFATPDPVIPIPDPVIVVPDATDAPAPAAAPHVQKQRQRALRRQKKQLRLHNEEALAAAFVVYATAEALSPVTSPGLGPAASAAAIAGAEITCPASPWAGGFSPWSDGVVQSRFESPERAALRILEPRNDDDDDLDFADFDMAMDIDAHRRDDLDMDLAHMVHAVSDADDVSIAENVSFEDVPEPYSSRRRSDRDRDRDRDRDHDRDRDRDRDRSGRRTHKMSSRSSRPSAPAHRTSTSASRSRARREDNTAAITGDDLPSSRTNSLSRGPAVPSLSTGHRRHKQTDAIRSDSLRSHQSSGSDVHARSPVLRRFDSNIPPSQRASRSSVERFDALAESAQHKFLHRTLPHAATSVKKASPPPSHSSRRRRLSRDAAKSLSVPGDSQRASKRRSLASPKAQGVSFASAPQFPLAAADADMRSSASPSRRLTPQEIMAHHEDARLWEHEREKSRERSHRRRRRNRSTAAEDTDADTAAALGLGIIDSPVSSGAKDGMRRSRSSHQPGSRALHSANLPVAVSGPRRASMDVAPFGPRGSDDRALVMVSSGGGVGSASAGAKKERAQDEETRRKKRLEGRKKAKEDGKKPGLLARVVKWPWS